jgi:hypothetical protein
MNYKQGFIIGILCGFSIGLSTAVIIISLVSLLVGG